ncbi:MAG: NrfD/PsrC family molybdoenzyme membrane anchor subunit [Myxococcota bacterium]
MMTSTAHPVPTPVGGSSKGVGITVLTLLALLGVALIIWRFAVGLGQATGLSDGYPWGLWIAFDVVTGTALACGGYAIGLLVYIMNRGQYHPLVRPALLTSALGYSLAAVAITIDVGRPWMIWRIPLSVGKWNLDSALLEVALCVMAYIVVLWIELSPAFLERWARSDSRWGAMAEKLKNGLERFLLWIIALGVILPTMHQSSLGTVITLAGPRLHPLWNTGWIPLLFLLSCIAMGYAVVVMESSISSRSFGLAREDDMLSRLARPAGWCLLAFIGVRFGDILLTGKAAFLAEVSVRGFMFWLESILFVAAAWMLLGSSVRRSMGGLFRTAILVVAAGALYRFDAYLVAFQPGPQWSYFPTVPEIMTTVGLVAIEIFIYIYVVRHFPILAGLKPSVAQQRKSDQS